VYITSHVIFHESIFLALPAPLSAPSCSTSFDNPSFDLWLSTLLPTSSDSHLSTIFDILPSFLNPSFPIPRSDTAPNVSADLSSSLAFDFDAVLPSSFAFVPIVLSQSALF